MKWYLDIETRVTRNEFPYANKALEEISLIQIVRESDIVVFGTRDLIEVKPFDMPLVYNKCSDEVAMLNKFLDFLNTDNPEVIYAWNGDRFDFPYIFNRLKNLGLDVDKLKNDNRRYIDLMLLYKKHGDKLKSYSLDSVSEHELNDTKVKHDEFEDFDSFYTGKNYKICGKYDDNVREEIRQLKIIESESSLTEEQAKRLDNLIFFNYVYYGVKDSLLMKRIDNNKNLSSYI